MAVKVALPDESSVLVASGADCPASISSTVPVAAPARFVNGVTETLNVSGSFAYMGPVVASDRVVAVAK